METLVTTVVVHDNPIQITSRVHHGTLVWYVRPSLDRYISMKCYMPVTGVIRFKDTLQYITNIFMSPTTTTEDYLRQADIYILSPV